MTGKTGGTKSLNERLSEARKAMGFSLAQASELLGINNYQTLSAIESGKRKLNAHELGAMADLYGRSLDYFFQAEMAPDPVPLWRKSAESDVGKIQRVFLSFLENYSKLEELLSLKRRWKGIQRNYERADFSERGFNVADKLGAEICDLLDLGSRPAANLLNVLENDLRIKILHVPLDIGLSGASVVESTLGVGILINAKDAPWRRNFDLAHELFHVVTWNVFSHGEVGNGTVKTKPEQYADTFASSLLLPKRHLSNALEEVAPNHQIRYVDIIELAKDFEVSTSAVLWRLVTLGILKRRNVEKAIDDPELKKIDRSMRKGMYYKKPPSKFPTRYVSLACRCLLEGRISRGTFAKYLEIERAEVDGFLKQSGFMQESYEKIAFA